MKGLLAGSWWGEALSSPQGLGLNGPTGPFKPSNDDNAQNEFQEYDSKPHSAPRLSFSFSRPYSRFSIARPKPPLKTALKLSFLKKASTVESVPELFNRLPKISDHYTSLITVNAHCTF